MTDIAKIEGGMASVQEHNGPAPPAYPNSAAPYPGGYPVVTNQPQISTNQTQFSGFAPSIGQPGSQFGSMFDQQSTQSQTTAASQAPILPGLSGVPVGLEYLTQLDQLLIKQKIELMELVTNLETSNKYEIFNTMGQQVYLATEDSNCCARQFCGPERPFEIGITDGQSNEVIHISRPFKCCNVVCCPCNKHEVTVTVPSTEQVLGTIKQDWSCLPSYSIFDGNGSKLFNINGPCSLFHCCQDINFEISDLNGVQLGNIQKQFRGMAAEAFTDADNFSVTFPLDLDVKMKAVFVGAVFLIDFMYFEHQNQSNAGNPSLGPQVMNFG